MSRLLHFGTEPDFMCKDSKKQEIGPQQIRAARSHGRFCRTPSRATAFLPTGDIKDGADNVRNTQRERLLAL